MHLVFPGSIRRVFPTELIRVSYFRDFIIVTIKANMECVDKTLLARGLTSQLSESILDHEAIN